jgi:pimeloyl-ACP methyl ester carboxylesterase
MSESGIADVAGARLAWWADGAGPPLVLVHAGVADARMWEPLLAELAGVCRTVRYDMRGFGRSRAAAGTFSSARDLAGLLDALGIERAHVAGASFGGRVALEFAATQPARVESLVLLAAALPDIDPSPELQAFADAEEEAIEESRIADAVQVNVQMWAGGSSPAVQALVADMQRTAFELQLREGAEEVELDPPVSSRLAQIAVPATVAIGDRDVADFETVAQRLAAELPDARLERIADAGHLLALDQPAAVARLIAGHLARLVTAPASPPR